jgi:hypothetical protein
MDDDVTPILRRHDELPISNDDKSGPEGVSVLKVHCLPGILKRVIDIVVVQIELFVSSRRINMSVNIHIAVALGVVQLPALLGDVRRAGCVMVRVHVAIHHDKSAVNSLGPHLVVQSGNDVLLGRFADSQGEVVGFRLVG